jgi:hypothetical protein
MGPAVCSRWTCPQPWHKLVRLGASLGPPDGLSEAVVFSDRLARTEDRVPIGSK